MNQELNKVVSSVYLKRFKIEGTSREANDCIFYRILNREFRLELGGNAFNPLSLPLTTCATKVSLVF